MLKNNLWVNSAIGTVFLLTALFVLYPVGMVLNTGFILDTGFSLDVFKKIFLSTSAMEALGNSLKLGVAVAVVGTVIGYIFAYIVTMTSVPLKKFFRLVATFPIISPPFVIALSAIMLLGNNGLITRYLIGTGVFEIYGFWGLLLVETICYFPTAFLVMSGIFASMDPVLIEAAKNQGATPFQSFKDVIFPLSKPGIYSALLLIFIESLADFGNPLVLSGDYKVLSVQAYLKITGEFDLPGGAGLALLLLVPSLIAFFIQKYFVDKKTFVTMSGKSSGTKHAKTTSLNKFLLLIPCSLFAGVILLVYGTVIYGSLVNIWGVNHGLTFSHYTTSLSESADYIWDSFILAGIATPITALLGTLIAYLIVRFNFKGRNLLEVSSMLTFAVPGTVVGIGYVMAFNNQPLLLTGTAAIIVILFIFRNAPVGIRSAVAGLKQIDPSIEEASSNLGASYFTTFRKIVIPLIAPAFFSGLAYSFVRCMTAISAVIFVVSGQWNLLTIAILGYVENSALSTASAMCVMLVITVSLILTLMNTFVLRLGVQR